LDSSVLLAELAAHGRHVFPVYVRAGLHWERQEIKLLRRFIKALPNNRIEPVSELEFPTVDVSAGHWSVTGRNVPGYHAPISSNYILGRNLGLLAKASIFCAHNRIGEIAMAQLEANPFPDARSLFFRAMERAVTLGTGLPLKIRSPFLGRTKAQVIKLGRGLPLELTLSCARPQRLIHCGSCTKCAERVEAFVSAGVPDPTRYARTSAA